MNYKEQTQKYIAAAFSVGASDIHLVSDTNPYVRVNKVLRQIENQDILQEEDVKNVLKELVGEEKFNIFLESNFLLFGYEEQREGVPLRIRGTAYTKRGKTGIALRLIYPLKKTIEELGLPPLLKDVMNRKYGFFLVVGPIGQGKSTTLASMIQYINKTAHKHVVTVEDPIEYVFESDKSIISQQETGSDVATFEDAFNLNLRMDVDVLMLGEMRNTRAFQYAMSAAETGHLVLSTLHTNSASQTIHRIVDSFPADQQNQIRLQLSSALLGIFSIRLVNDLNGNLIPAYEVMFNNNAIANLIRENRIENIDNVIETSREDKMVTLNQTLARLVSENKISIDTAREYSTDMNILNQLL